MLKNIFRIESPALTPALAFLTPLIFIWSHNWYVYPWVSLSVSFLVAILLSFFIICLGGGCYSVYLIYKNRIPRWSSVVGKLFLCIVSIEIFSFLTQLQLITLFGNLSSYKFLLIKLSGSIVVFLLVYKFTFKLINIFLCACIIIFGIS